MPGSSKPAKTKAPRNRTIEVTPDEAKRLRRGLLFGVDGKDVEIKNAVICGDSFEVLKKLPAASFDLLFADPPYNLAKEYGQWDDALADRHAQRGRVRHADHGLTGGAHHRSRSARASRPFV